jgi:hypothetical protein
MSLSPTDQFKLFAPNSQKMVQETMPYALLQMSKVQSSGVTLIL